MHKKLKAKTRGALCFGRGGLVGKVSPLPSEVQRQKLTPHSGIDVQGFTWASIKIEAGKYGKTWQHTPILQNPRRVPQVTPLLYNESASQYPRG
jgi:hypothetical protein